MLGESVLAGNMYVNDSLLKQPPYLFQVAGSAKEQMIYRTPIDKSRKILSLLNEYNFADDSRGQPLFKEGFTINILRKKSKIIIVTLIIHVWNIWYI